MGEGEKREGTYLFDVEACPDVDEHVVGVGELAFDVEGVGEGDEDGFFFCCFVNSLFSLVAGGRGGGGEMEDTHCQTTTTPTGRPADTL